MNKLKKIFYLIIVIIVMVFSVTSCKKNELINTITLTVWGAEKDQEMLKEMCESYAKANSDKTYKFLYGVQGEDEAANKVLNDLESGPDVYSFSSDQINKLIAGGALARIGGEYEKAVKENDSEASVDSATVTINGDNQLYAYPSTCDNCYFVYYDKRVYTDKSQLSTLDSMLEIANKNGKKIHFRLNDDGWYLSSFFFTNPDLKYEVTYNENMVEETIDINYDSNAGLEVMKSLRTYINNDALIANTDDSKIIAAFTPSTTGKTEAAAAISGTWNAEILKGVLGENLGVCVLPKVKINNEEVQLSGYIGYKLIGVNGFSKNKEEAHKLALWLTNEENQLKRFNARGFAPTNNVVAKKEEVLNDSIISVVLEQAKLNRTQKNVPSTYWTPMSSLITPLISAKDEGKIITDAKLLELLEATCNSIRKNKN